MEKVDIAIDKIELDLENPRIREVLEKYEDDITDERIYFALQTQSSSNNDNNKKESAGSTFSKLKESIKATEGIKIPINVVKKNDHYVCTDGNTRLMIYRDFKSKGIRGHWETIPAIVIKDEDIEKIRMIAHIVGPRDWPAYEKAKYLHDLQESTNYSLNEIADYCGGDKSEIRQLIDAYEDMKVHYKDKNEHFDITRFSGFVEFQNKKVQKSITDAGCSFDNFGEWIRDGWIKNLRDVRKLPQVLADKEAKKIFLKGGINSIKTALNLIVVKNSSKSNIDLSKLNLSDLAMLMSDKVRNLTRGEMQEMKLDPNDILASLRDLETDLNDLINDLDNK